MIQIALQHLTPGTMPDTPSLVEAVSIIESTRNWVERAVIGLNLCPFAKAVHVKSQIRYAVSSAGTPEELAADLYSELNFLAASDSESLDTTLLIHPFVLNDFADYNDFLEIADAILVDGQLEGEIQIASFHPGYQFADAPPADISNYTNRSPYPVLHLLREASITRAVAAYPDAEDIFNRNIATLRNLGLDGWKRLGVEAIKTKSDG